MGNELEYRANVESLQETFLQLRDRFHLDERVGLGLLPRSHLPYTPCATPEARGYENELGMFQVSMGRSFIWRGYDASQGDNVIISPKFNGGKSYIVSMWSKRLGWDADFDFPLDIMAFSGMVSHEFAHVLQERGELPHELASEDEAGIDIMASEISNPNLVIYALDLLSRRVIGYDPRSKSFEHLAPSLIVFAGLEMRKRKVTEYFGIDS